jgi:hypothetical protein
VIRKAILLISLSLIATSCSNNDAELQALREQVEALSSATTAATTTTPELSDWPLGILSPQISDAEYKANYTDCSDLAVALLKRMDSHVETFNQRADPNDLSTFEAAVKTYFETQSAIDRNIPTARSTGMLCESKFPLLYGSFFTSLFDALDFCASTYENEDYSFFDMEECTLLLSTRSKESNLTRGRLFVLTQLFSSLE